jgi:hypothetical protein
MDVDQDGNGTANVSGNSNASESNARTVTSDGKHVDIDVLLRLVTWPFLHAQDSPPRPPFLFCLLDLFLIGGWSEPFSVFLLSCGREVFTTRKYPLRLVSMGSQGSHSSRCAIRMPPFAPSGGVPRKTTAGYYILCLCNVESTA